MEYKLSQSNLQQIKDHLWRVDKDFKPALHTYVNIEDYSKKLEKTAIRLEFFDQEQLVGLMAGYYNKDKKNVFVTNFSIETNYRGEGMKWVMGLIKYICSQTHGNTQLKESLPHKIINFGDQWYQSLRTRHGVFEISEVHTEVRKENALLSSFYKKIGFKELKKQKDSTYLIYQI